MNSILLIGEETYNQKHLLPMLVKKGFRVKQTLDLIETTELLHEDAIDLILLDVKEQSQCGTEFRAIK
ncbi:hypothetical protein LIT32_25235 (plasmid) [Bacillus sp. CMF21]|uniref:hypothetical protein n=1 Tax=Metabacillus dongyingensis TaxID=2874282 RepID=UPI001FB4E267|nr:hypothetical protein [Metabacillus dongyingensis]UNJ81352.1 hypothetical protein [Metabacillus dongyingensis]USK31398.1 hypothetical protein LIT32_25235 [Bacillus sp. CMF21]